MEYLIEFILELVFEESIEASKNNKIPKYIRYPLIAIILLFFIAVIAIILLAGFLSFKENKIVGIFFILLGLFILVMSIIKFRKTYLNKTNKN